MFDITGFLTYWLIEFGIYAIVALCLNMEVGFTGMANFGLVAFYGIGSFMAGYISISTFLLFYGYNYPIYSLDAIVTLGKISALNPLLSMSIFLVSLVVAFVVAGIVGYLVTYPTLRVGPAFLGITILSFGEMLRVFMKHFNPTGGSYGLLGVPHPFAWITNPGLKSGLFLLLTLGLLAMIFYYFQALSNSPYGRVLKSIREDEIAALCIGKPVPGIKAQLLFVASGVSGVAGALLAFHQGSVSPDMLVTTYTFEVWSMVILGGRGNNWGALLGALAFSLLGRASSLLTFFLPGLPIDPNYVRWMLMGAVIVIVLMYRPKGILPEKPIYTEAWSIYETRKERKTVRRSARALRRGLYWLIGRSAE